MQSTGPAITATALTRRFDALVAVDHIDLTVKSGSIVGLLGPNGAGKSTTIKMLTTLLPPTSGSAQVAGWDVTRESASYHLASDIAFRDVHPEECAGLFLTGGRAPEYLRDDEDLLRITRHFFEAGKPVASVCHGIEILTAADVIQGRTVTTVRKCARDAAQGGARFVDKPVVVDGNLVTARTWHDTAPFLRVFMKLLQA